MGDFHLISHQNSTKIKEFRRLTFVDRWNKYQIRIWCEKLSGLEPKTDQFGVESSELLEKLCFRELRIDEEEDDDRVKRFFLFNFSFPNWFTTDPSNRSMKCRSVYNLSAQLIDELA